MSFSISEPRTRVSTSVRISSIYLSGDDLIVRFLRQRGRSACPYKSQNPNSCRNNAARMGHPRFCSKLQSCLKEGGRAAFPRLAFFLGDVFHVGDVGSGLGQDVVQVIADADKRESFFQEFANAGRAEEE